jgi:hypothetical protein
MAAAIDRGKKIQAARSQGGACRFCFRSRSPTRANRKHEYDSLGEEFERKEHKMFGADDFEKMVERPRQIVLQLRELFSKVKKKLGVPMKRPRPRPEALMKMRSLAKDAHVCRTIGAYVMAPRRSSRSPARRRPLQAEVLPREEPA